MGVEKKLHRIHIIYKPLLYSSRVETTQNPHHIENSLKPIMTTPATYYSSSQGSSSWSSKMTTLDNWMNDMAREHCLPGSTNIKQSSRCWDNLSSWNTSLGVGGTNSMARSARCWANMANRDT